MDFLTFYDEIKQQILEAAEENLEGNIDFKMVPKNGQELHGISFFPGGRPCGNNGLCRTYVYGLSAEQ